MNKKATSLSVIFVDKWDVFPFHWSIDPPDGESKMNTHHRTQISSANYRHGQILPGRLLSLATLSHATWTGKTSLIHSGKTWCSRALCFEPSKRIINVQIQSLRVFFFFFFYCYLLGFKLPPEKALIL